MKGQKIKFFLWKSFEGWKQLVLFPNKYIVPGESNDYKFCVVGFYQRVGCSFWLAAVMNFWKTFHQGVEPLSRWKLSRLVLHIKLEKLKIVHRPYFLK